MYNVLDLARFNANKYTQTKVICFQYRKVPRYDFLHTKEKSKTITKAIIELMDKRPLSLLRPAVFPCFTTKLRTRS